MKGHCALLRYNKAVDVSKPKAVALGVFDGIHIGHQSLIRRAIGLARAKGLDPYVVTFHPHPANVLSDRNIRLIMPLRRRVEIIKELGAEAIVQPFDRELAKKTAAEFFAMLRDRLGCRAVVAGRDFSCGSDMVMGEGLHIAATRQQIACTLVELERGPEGQKISSERIRRLLAEGKAQQANALLGRPFRLYGKAVHGEKRGRQIGFPTINLDVENELLPMEGVYAAVAHINGRKNNGVLSIGRKPTFIESGPIEVELHIFGALPEIYGEELVVDVIEFLRGQRRFADAGALKSAIIKDIENAKRILERP